MMAVWRDTRDHVPDWCKKSWAWKQGWLYYKRNPYDLNFPSLHEEGSDKCAQFDEGWNEAVFWAKVVGGYFDE